MTLHKDLNGNIHDDMDGTAINMLPSGCVQITDAQADAIRNPLPTLAQAQAARIADVTTLQNAKLYSNIPAAFPSGTKIIQMRNSEDWVNFLTAITDASLLAGSDQVSFRTLDNVTQALTAAQLIAIGVTVIAVKKTILEQGWVHDDAIMALATVSAVQAYDITTGWPV